MNSHCASLTSRTAYLTTIGIHLIIDHHQPLSIVINSQITHPQANKQATQVIWMRVSDIKLLIYYVYVIFNVRAQYFVYVLIYSDGTIHSIYTFRTILNSILIVVHIFPSYKEVPTFALINCEILVTFWVHL